MFVCDYSPNNALAEQTLSSEIITLSLISTTDVNIRIMIVLFMGFCTSGARFESETYTLGVAACSTGSWDQKNLQEWTRSVNAVTPETTDLFAVVLALEKAWRNMERLKNKPRIKVYIFSDSRYACECMTERQNAFIRNMWITDAGIEVANRSLLERGHELAEKLEEHGSVKFIRITKAQNQITREAAKKKLDRMVAHNLKHRPKSPDAVLSLPVDETPSSPVNERPDEACGAETH